MTLIQGFDVAASGLTAQRVRMETVASNLANIHATRTPEGGPYRRRMPVFQTVSADPIRTGSAQGVRVQQIAVSEAEPLVRFEPGHPDADAAGFVQYPNIDPVIEMVDMVSATRSYEANVTAIKSLRSMMSSALDLIR